MSGPAGSSVFFRSRRLRVLARAMLICLAAATVSTGSAAKARGSCLDTSASQKWMRMPPVKFPSGGKKIVSVAIPSSNPRRIYATNGTSIVRSTNGGCSYKKIFSLNNAELSYDLDEARITTVAVVPTVPKRIYAGIATQAGTDALGLLPLLPLAHVITSSNGGAQWEELDDGLELAAGAPVSISVSPHDPDRTYLLETVR